MSAAAHTSLAAQGLLFRLRIIARRSDRYGYLSKHGLAIPPALLALQCGTTLEQFEALFPEISDSLKLSSDKVWFDPGMVKKRERLDNGIRRNNSYKDRKRGAPSRDTGGDASVTPSVTQVVTAAPSLKALDLPDTTKLKEKEKGAPSRDARCDALAQLIAKFVPDPDWGDKPKAQRNAQRTALNLITSLGSVEAAAALYKAAFEKKSSSSLAVLGQIALDLQAKKPTTGKLPGRDAYVKYGQ